MYIRESPPSVVTFYNCLAPISEHILIVLTNPASKVRGGSWEEQPHVQGVVAVRVQEGLEELSHVEGQEGWW